jgi:hypothetical protein
MAITVTPIQNNQTFGAWLSTTNRLANIISQNTVTTDGSSGGSLTTGNGYVNGFFGANYLYVNTGLVGGNVSTNGQILVLSNTFFQYSTANLLSVTGNTTVRAITAVVNSFAITSNTVSITGNTTIANTLVVTGNTTANSFLGNGNFLTTINATNITTGTLPMAQLGSNVVNTTAAFTISGLQTFQANLHTGNSTVNTQFSNSIITLANSTTTTAVGLDAIRVGTTSSNVVIANTTSRFGGNVVITGTANVSANLVVGASGELVISNGAGIEANGTLGSSGQLLASNGTGVYWSTITVSGGTVTNVATGSGLTGGPITTTGTISVVANSGIVANATGVFVLANNGIVSNSTGVFVLANTGLIANATGVHVNSSMFVNTSGSYTLTGVQTFNANVVIGATSELLIANGAGIQANGTFGTSGQVLSSNGTGVYWANVAAASGGSGLFNTSLTSSVGFAANSTLSPAFTAPGTAGLRYIVHSIHVTNIGTANSGVTAKINGATYANVSLATTVPLPVESAVELLKMPKVMQPSDVLSIQVQDNTPLHATITYETQSNTNFFGAGVDITADATYTDLWVDAALRPSVIQSILLSNDDGVNDVKARVVWTDAGNNIQGYYCYDLIIPADSTVEILEQAKYLPALGKIRVYANVGNRLEAMVAGRLI